MARCGCCRKAERPGRPPATTVPGGLARGAVRDAEALLTDAGRQRLEQAAPDHVSGVRQTFLDHLDANQIRNLGEAFAAVMVARSVGPARRRSETGD